MIELSKLYQIADNEKIEVDCFDLNKCEAFSIMDDDGECFIAIDPYKLQSTQDERVKLAHEIGHCVTGSFYNIYATVDHRLRHENCADKWAIKKLIPEAELECAVAAGYTDIWELAEKFGVTVPFMEKAVSYYTYGNVASELYFGR